MYRVVIGTIGLVVLGVVCFVIAWYVNTPLGPTSDQESIAIFGVGLVAMTVVNYFLGVVFRRRQ